MTQVTAIDSMQAKKRATGSIRDLYFCPRYVQADLTPRRESRSVSLALTWMVSAPTGDAYQTAHAIKGLGGRDLIREVEGR